MLNITIGTKHMVDMVDVIIVTIVNIAIVITKGTIAMEVMMESNLLKNWKKKRYLNLVKYLWFNYISDENFVKLMKT